MSGFTRHRRPRRSHPSAQRTSAGNLRARSLRFEPLETRRLLTITVDTLIDELDGSIVDGDISLRDAIAAAPSGDTVDFDPILTSGGPATITLALGELLIGRSLTVLGPGADLLTIDANGGSRVITIDDGNSANLINVGVIGLTITGGNTAGFLYGGGIRNRENLTITGCAISGNSSSFTGGGIWNGPGGLTIFDSTISGNSASHGGGIFTGASGSSQPTTITGSTISGNTATVSGGGLFSLYGTTALRHTTITDNTAPTGSGVASYGSSLSQTEVYSSIIAGNTPRDVDVFGDVDINSFQSEGYNLVGDGNAVAAFNNDDQTGVTDPGLGPLADYGGPTHTHAVLLNSPAFNAGDPNFEPPPDTDQRGAGFPRVSYGRIDIGSHEALFDIDSNLVVDTLLDELDENIEPGDLSLREAIALANFELDSQLISFAPSLTSAGPATISLTLGELAISNAVMISGPGASLLTIDAGLNSRIFNINADADGSGMLTDIEISGLTLTGGEVMDFSNGGAILNLENLTVRGTIISGNVAAGRGGGIYSRDGNVTVVESTISGNSAGQSGGGVENRNGNLAITGSTISGNSASLYGGGVLSRAILANQSTTISSSTLSGNTAGAGGGGVFILQGLAQIGHSTITKNTAPAGGGSGVASYGIGAQTTVRSSIISGNTNSDVDFVGLGSNSFVSAGYNLVGGGSGVGSFNEPGDATGVVDPRLGPLADNGGPTRTHALLIGSPAVNAGDPAAVAGMEGVPAFDQRGNGFARVQHGRIDIGAYEALFTVGQSLVVDTLLDELDGDIAPGDLALREALWLTNLDPDSQTITFAAALTSGGPATSTLSLLELAIENPVTITGPGANLLTIDAAGHSRIFTVDDGSSNLIEVGISQLTLTGGDVRQFGDGGAVYNLESLTVSRCIISGNAAVGGGGIYNRDGSLTVSYSTLSDNSVALYGGGIFNTSGNLTITKSTIAGNSATSGGGIFSGAASNTRITTITNSTISGNTATVRGGGVLNVESRTVFRYSTITRNSAPSGGAGVASYGTAATQSQAYSTIIAGNTGSDVEIVSGAVNSFISLGYNLIGNGNGLGAFNKPGDQTGVTNPRLGPLADNGGPTRTHALLLNSPAINAGDPAAVAGVDGVPATDQRGSGFPRVVDAIIDIGAFENQNPGLIVSTLVDESDSDFSAGDISLREAIEVANVRKGAQTITFATSLTSAGPAIIPLTLGELKVLQGVTILGPGANLLAIHANSGSRILNLDDGVPGQTFDAAISGLTLTGGSVTGMSNGGAILNVENLTVSDSIVSGNAAGGGGGIYNRDGNLIVNRSSIVDNSASLYGGGIRNRNGNLTIIGSTISGNSASGAGGIFSGNLGSQLTTIVSSTISGNTATLSNGGGILNEGLIEIGHSTITKNTAPAGGGSGVASYGIGAQTTVRSSIISGNTNSDVDFVGLGSNSFVSAGYNLVGGGSGVGSFNEPGDATGVVDPRLGPLADNGGPTRTHALLIGSPAVNAGDPAAVAGMEGVPAFDQRGNGFARVQHGRIDIGAYEALFTVGQSLVVDTLLDELDGDIAPGDLALREALWLTNLDPDSQTITFAAALTSGGPATSTLSLLELAIENPVTITGPGANLLTIDAAGHSRIFTVDDGSSNFINVALSRLTLTGGSVGGFKYGGAVLNRENLTITASTLRGNSTSFLGGGIWTGSGNLTVVDSTIVGNAASHGGGIFSGAAGSSQTTTVIGSTISGNTASVGGGGMLNMQGLVAIRHSTITHNTAPAGSGSGVASYGNSTTQTSSYSTIIAGNTSSDVDQFGGTGNNSFDSDGYNLVGSGNALAAFSNTDQVGVSNPRLGPLADNGGPTSTHALAAGSQAFDAGDPVAVAGMNGIPAFDQRGSGFPRVFNGRIDIGAFESQIILPALAGDYNENGVVDASDYVVWRRANGSMVPSYTGADGNGDGIVDQDDYVVWRANFGSTLPVAAATSAVILVEISPALIDTQVAPPAESASVRSAEPVGELSPARALADLLSVVGSRSKFDAVASHRPPHSGALEASRWFALPARQGMLLASCVALGADAENLEPQIPHGRRMDFVTTGDSEDPSLAALDLAFEGIGASF